MPLNTCGNIRQVTANTLPLNCVYIYIILMFILILILIFMFVSPTHTHTDTHSYIGSFIDSCTQMCKHSNNNNNRKGEMLG